MLKPSFTINENGGSRNRTYVGGNHWLRARCIAILPCLHKLEVKLERNRRWCRRFKLEPLPGFEPGAFWFVARRSSVKLQGRGAYHRIRTDITILEGWSSTIELGGHMDRTSRECKSLWVFTFRTRFSRREDCPQFFFW